MTNPPKKILVARGDVLGDVVETTVLIAPLKEKFPDSELFFLIQKDYFEVLESLPEVAGCIEDPFPYSLPWTELKTISKVAKALKKHQFDLFLGAWEHPRYAVLSFLAGIPVRIGHRTSLVNWLLYSRTVSLDYQDFLLHKVDYNCELLKPLAINLETLPSVYLQANEKAKQTMLEKFPAIGKQQPVVVNLDAGNPIRILLKEQFIQIIQHLSHYSNQPVVLIGRHRNIEAAKAIQASVPSTQLINTVNQLSLAETVSVISEAKFIISSDSGPVHIASAFKVPVIVYYMNRIQNAFHWGPWKVPHVIAPSHHNCIDVCSPTTCQKTDCRVGVDTSAICDTIDQFMLGEFPNPDQSKEQWLNVTGNIAFLGPEAQRMKAYLGDSVLKSRVFSLNEPISKLKRQFAEGNINIIIYAGEKLSPWTWLKIEIVRRWSANFIAFFPKFVRVTNEFELEQFFASIRVSN